MARFRRRFVLSRVRSPLGAKALGPLCASVYPVGARGVCCRLFAHTFSSSPASILAPSPPWTNPFASSNRHLGRLLVFVRPCRRGTNSRGSILPPSAPSSSAFRPLSCPCVSVAPSPSPTQRTSWQVPLCRSFSLFFGSLSYPSTHALVQGIPKGKTKKTKGVLLSSPVRLGRGQVHWTPRAASKAGNWERVGTFASAQSPSSAGLPRSWVSLTKPRRVRIFPG